MENGIKELHGHRGPHGIVGSVLGIDWIGLMLIWKLGMFGRIWSRVAGEKWQKNIKDDGLRLIRG